MSPPMPVSTLGRGGGWALGRVHGGSWEIFGAVRRSRTEPGRESEAWCLLWLSAPLSCDLKPGLASLCLSLYVCKSTSLGQMISQAFPAECQ